ncbi:hypothetical protein C7W93_22970 [Glaciimonas sp. PCH181]|nr:hypothetical protein C7W93_22970 [Glaciimonas sp. PCH181]
MKNIINTAHQGQDDAKKIPLVWAKDGVKTILWVGRSFKFIDQIQTDQLSDCIKKESQSSDANDTVNLALLITDTDDHFLSCNGTHFEGVQFELIENFGIQFSDFLGGDKGCFHKVPSVVLKGVSRPDMIGYAQKYMRKSLLNSHIAGVI